MRALSHHVLTDRRPTVYYCAASLMGPFLPFRPAGCVPLWHEVGTPGFAIVAPPAATFEPLVGYALRGVCPVLCPLPCVAFAQLTRSDLLRCFYPMLYVP